jgi:hypothetical protein
MHSIFYAREVGLTCAVNREKKGLFVFDLRIFIPSMSVTYWKPASTSCITSTTVDAVLHVHSSLLARAKHGVNRVDCMCWVGSESLLPYYRNSGRKYI